jgi:autotransporter-associated beta strand protein
LVEAGSGSLLLDAINSFGGGITVQGGTLGLQLSGALPSDTMLDVAASGTVLLDGTEQTAQAIAGTNGGQIAINGGILIVDQTTQGPDIDFAGASGQLTFTSSDSLMLTGSLNSTILGFNPAAQINLTGITYSSDDLLQYADGTLTIDSSSVTLAVLHFDPAGTYDFFLSPGVGDSLALTDLACFAEGTMIATRHGDVPVERLRLGEFVVTADGGELPVVWIGCRPVASSRHPDPELVWPVRVRAHAFGKERPSRDLFLSPDHAVFVADVLIPIKYLINGRCRSIRSRITMSNCRGITCCSPRACPPSHCYRQAIARTSPMAIRQSAYFRTSPRPPCARLGSGKHLATRH